jgi:hypothetical protein
MVIVLCWAQLIRAKRRKTADSDRAGKNDRKLENLPGSAGALADVEPVHLGWLHQAIRVWSGRYGAVCRQCAYIPLPQPAAWVAIIVELIGGILILVGYQTRWVALALAIGAW